MDSLEDVWPDQYKANFDKLKTSNSESDYVEASFNYLRETTIICVILGNSLRSDDHKNPKKWSRNEAIICGSLLRIAHLLNGFLSEIVNHRMETAMIFERSIYETCINIMYLVKKNDPLVFDEYVKYSLRYEKRLYLEIQGNIAVRGSKLYIEERMMKSIENSFLKSRIDMAEIDETARDTWGGSIRKRFKYLNIDHLYDVLISRVSHTIHGNWQDLLTHYIAYNEDGTFEPKGDSSVPKPQAICAMTTILVKTINAFAEWFIDSYSEKEIIIERLDQIDSDVRIIDESHEGYLVRKKERIEKADIKQ